MSDVILTPGGQARIYKNGQLKMAVLVPHGRMEVRSLAPGDYLAKDEDGNSVEFIVDANAEVAIVQIPDGADDFGPVASAETPIDVPPAPAEPQPDPIYPGTDASDDAHLERERVLAAVGTGAGVGQAPDDGVIEAQQEGHAEEPNRAKLADLEDMTVAELRARAKEVGVKQAGAKAELKQRIVDAVQPDAGQVSVEHTGEATADEPPAEEQMEGQDGPPEATPEPTDGVMDGDRVKDEHHLEH